MENKSLYSVYASRFAEASTDSLITSFNNQVGKRGFNSARAAHDMALFHEIRHRGIDVSAISSGESISFAQKIRLQGNVLLIVE